MKIINLIYDKLLYVYCYMWTDIYMRMNEMEDMLIQIRKNNDNARNK